MPFDNKKDYAHILDKMRDAIFVHDLEGNFIIVNDEAVERYGYSRNEFFDMTPHELDSEKSEPLIKDRLNEIKERGSLTFKAEHVTKDGKNIPVEINSSLIEIKGEKAILSVARDITEREKARESLRRTEERYEALVETAYAGIGITDFDDNFTFVNDRFAEMLGYDKRELIGKNILDISLEKEKEKFKKETEKRKKGKTSRYESRLVKKNGKVIDVLVYASPFKNAEGEFSGTIGVIIDITERKKMEEKLRNSEKKFRSYVENAPNGVFVVDSEGNYLEVNKSACEMTGYSEKEMLQMNILEIAALDARNKAQESFDRLLDKGRMRIELPYNRKDGSRRYWIINTVKLSEDRYLGFTEDVTERKNAENRLKDLLDERENIIHRLSHDLKTPLSPLVNLIPMVKDRVSKELDDETIEKDLEICEKNAFYLKELLDHILKIAEYSKSGRKSDLEFLKVKDLVKEWLSDFKERNLDEIIEMENIEFENNIDSDSRIEVDKMGLFEVFDNLAKNSLEHMSEEGKICFSAEEKGNSVVVKLRDTGDGLKEEELDNIFKYFYTTGKTTHKLESTGLGLPISKYIIENHNGSIWAERAEEDSGVVFCMELPKKQKEML